MACVHCLRRMYTVPRFAYAPGASGWSASTLRKSFSAEPRSLAAKADSPARKSLLISASGAAAVVACSAAADGSTAGEEKLCAGRFDGSPKLRKSRTEASFTLTIVAQSGAKIQLQL